MILGFIIGIFVGLLTALINTLPFFTGFADDVQTSLDTMGNLIDGANTFFPLDTLIQVAMIIIAFEVAINGFKILNWIFNKIRGSG